MKTSHAKIKFILAVFRNSFRLFLTHDTFTLGAALSYYTVFSIVPIIIIVMSIVAVVLGPGAAVGEVKTEIQGFLGSKGAEQLQELIKAVYKPGHNWLATGIAFILLIIGATSMFSQIRTSLNTVWEVKPQAKGPVIRFIIDRLFSFGMILCCAFLLLVSLVLHAGISAFTDYLTVRFSGLSVWVVYVVKPIWTNADKFLGGVFTISKVPVLQI